MGLYDRDYTQADSQSDYYSSPQMGLNLPKLTPVVKWLIIINFAIHLIGVFFFQAKPGTISKVEALFAVWPRSIPAALQLWRLVSYQFLHASGWHVLLNMVGLFFLGPTLERSWGSRKFLIFYLSCGVAGGAFFTILCLIHPAWAAPLIGASGSILGMLAACAILFPQFVVFIFIFPVPIRVAVFAFTVLYILNILAWGDNAGGDACHLAGMAAGAAYVLSQSWRDRFASKIQVKRWERTIADEQELRIELDRILEKVHKSGLHSLTRQEKNTLKDATEIERQRNI
jgi:membrane associated rhomboid family serine protease